MLRAMMHMPGQAGPGAKKQVQFARPKTAATTTRYDESRIKDKLAALERLEHQMNNNIESVAHEIDLLTMVKEAKQYAERDGKERGVTVTKAMILENSLCDEMREVKTLMLRDKNIGKFVSDEKNGLDLYEMCNIECLFASHNIISDISGVC